MHPPGNCFCSSSVATARVPRLQKNNKTKESDGPRIHEQEEPQFPRTGLLTINPACHLTAMSVPVKLRMTVLSSVRDLQHDLPSRRCHRKRYVAPSNHVEFRHETPRIHISQSLGLSAVYEKHLPSCAGAFVGLPKPQQAAPLAPCKGDSCVLSRRIQSRSKCHTQDHPRSRPCLPFQRSGA